MLRGNYFINWCCSCPRSRTEVTPLICVASPNHRFVELKDANYFMGNAEQHQLNSSAFSKTQIAPSASIRIFKRPKKLDIRLRQQGLNGNSCGLLFEVLKEFEMSRPISFTYDIVPSVMPFIHKAVQNYGQNLFLWSRPEALIMDLEIIREILSKSYIFQEPPSPISKLLIQGLATYEKYKWAKHRRLINPGFHP